MVLHDEVRQVGGLLLGDWVEVAAVKALGDDANASLEGLVFLISEQVVFDSEAYAVYELDAPIR